MTGYYGLPSIFGCGIDSSICKKDASKESGLIEWDDLI